MAGDGGSNVGGVVSCSKACSMEELPNGFAEVLQREIMADVEAVLARKADSLWERGKAELRDLKHERNQVVSSLGELQRRQDTLVAEHTKMHGALLEITGKLEYVANEMREALCALQKQRNGASTGKGVAPSLSAVLGAPASSPIACSALGPQLAAGLASIAAAQAAAVSAIPSTPADVNAMAAAVQAAAVVASRAQPGQADPAAEGPCTPPRAATAPSPTLGLAAAAPAAPAAPCIAPPLPGSPAVLLSLASALPSAGTPTQSLGQTSASSAQRLHIADCLDMDSSASSGSAGDATCAFAENFIAAENYAASLGVGALGSPGALGGDSSSQQLESPGTATAGLLEDWIPSTLPSFGSDLVWSSAMSQGLLKASGQMRAEAPAFVPGGTPSAAAKELLTAASSSQTASAVMEAPTQQVQELGEASPCSEARQLQFF